uniref:Uncharacterized protein n=1 Tax=Amphora coffeiformis TaxID=265554 RepID=A0A7S3PAM8_9STRA|eukprot:scaffold6754_cov148-Amphora_coffeaeformis.AAC.12
MKHPARRLRDSAVMGALFLSSTSRTANAFLPATGEQQREGVAALKSSNKDGDGGQAWWKQYMEVSDGAVSNKGAPDPFERMKQRPPRTSQNGGGGMASYPDPYSQNPSKNNYREESDAALRAAVTGTTGGAGGEYNYNSAAPSQPYGDDYDSPKWKGFMAVTDGPDPIDPLQQQRDEQLRKERERMQQEQQKNQPPRAMGGQRNQFTQQQQTPGQRSPEMPYPPSSRGQSMNDYADPRSKNNSNASDENIRARSAVQARMQAEMAKYGPGQPNNMNNQQSSAWPPPTSQDPYGPGRNYNPQQGPGPWAQQQPDQEENSSGKWSKYMSVSDGPDPVEPKSYETRKAEWEEENARWEAAQKEEQEREAREEAARLEVERKTREQQLAERRRLEDLERRKAQMMSVDNQPQNWEQHQARARARDEMAEQLAQAKLYEQMERARQESTERESEREQTVARYRLLRTQLETERRAQAEAEEEARRAEEALEVVAEDDDDVEDEEEAILDAAKIEAAIRAKAEKEEKAKADEAARKWEKAVARAKAKIMAEEMMKKGELAKDEDPAKRIESIPLAMSDEVLQTKSNPTADEKASKIRNEIQSRSETEDAEASRVEESNHRALLEAHLAHDENLKSKSSIYTSISEFKEPKDVESPKAVPTTLGVTPQKKKYGSSAAALNVFEATNSPRKLASGGKKEMTMAELAKKYRNLDKIRKDSPVASSPQKPTEDQAPPRELTMAELAKKFADLDKRPKNLPVSSSPEKPKEDPLPPPNQYIETRIEEARKRAQLAKMAELNEVEEANKPKGLDSTSRQQYFANRIEEARKRALASSLAARKAAPLATDFRQPSYATLQSDSKPTEKAPENGPDVKAPVDRKQYFADRIAASRKRALLASIEAAVTAKDSTIFVKGNIESTREKAAAAAAEDEADELADKALTALQEYFANRVAKGRKNELLAKIEEVFAEKDSAESSQNAKDKKEDPESKDDSADQSPVRVNLKSSPSSSMEEFKKMFSLEAKKTNGSSDPALATVKEGPKGATEPGVEMKCDGKDATGKSDVQPDTTASLTNGLSEGLNGETSTRKARSDRIDALEEPETKENIMVSLTDSLKEGQRGEIGTVMARCNGNEEVERPEAQANITASLTNGLTQANGVSEEPKGEARSAGSSTGDAEVKSTTEEINRAAAMSILGTKQNGEVKINGKAKINGNVEGKPSVNVEKRDEENELNGQSQWNGKKQVADTSSVEAGVNGTAKIVLEHQQNGEGELPVQPKATNPKEISPKAK